MTTKKRRKLDYQQVYNFFLDSGCELLSNEYVNAREPLSYRCSCGSLSETSYDNFRRGTRCKECGLKKLSEKFRHDYTFVKEYFEKQGCVLLSNSYKNSAQSLDYVCVCGREDQISFNNFKKGKRCMRCGQKSTAEKLRLTYYEVQKFFESQNCRLLSDSYTNDCQTLDYICSCGKKSQISYNKFKQGQRCRDCAIKKTAESKRYTYNEVRDIFIKRKCILLTTDYSGCRQKLDFMCSCGNLSSTTLTNFLRGKGCYSCGVKKISGPNNPNWKPWFTEEDRESRRIQPGIKEWRLNVFELGNYTCVKCGARGKGNLNAHHIDSYDVFKEKRTDVSNGATLCYNCHLDFHKTYGFGKNTRDQFTEWLGDLNGND